MSGKVCDESQASGRRELVEAMTSLESIDPPPTLAILVFSGWLVAASFGGSRTTS